MSCKRYVDTDATVQASMLRCVICNSQGTCTLTSLIRQLWMPNTALLLQHLPQYKSYVMHWLMEDLATKVNTRHLWGLGKNMPIKQATTAPRTNTVHGGAAGGRSICYIRPGCSVQLYLLLLTMSRLHLLSQGIKELSLWWETIFFARVKRLFTPKGGCVLEGSEKTIKKPLFFSFCPHFTNLNQMPVWAFCLNHVSL